MFFQAARDYYAERVLEINKRHNTPSEKTGTGEKIETTEKTGKYPGVKEHFQKYFPSKYVEISAHLILLNIEIIHFLSGRDYGAAIGRETPLERR